MKGGLNWVPSPYGDPEEALLLAESGDDDDGFSHRYMEDTRVLIGLLCPRDRILWHLVTEGWSQDQTAEIIGIQQPSISNRLKELRRWARQVLPIREKLRTFDEPAMLTSTQWETYQRVVWCHQSLSEVARIQDKSQGTTYYSWQKVKFALRTQGEPGHYETVVEATRRIQKWTAPHGPVVVDSPLTIPPHPAADPEVTQIIGELDRMDQRAATSCRPLRMSRSSFGS